MQIQKDKKLKHNNNAENVEPKLGTLIFFTQILFGFNTFWLQVFWTWIFLDQKMFFTNFLSTRTTTTTETLMDFDTIEMNLDHIC